MGFFAKIVKYFKPLTIFAEGPMIHVWQDTKTHLCIHHEDNTAEILNHVKIFYLEKSQSKRFFS